MLSFVECLLLIIILLGVTVAFCVLCFVGGPVIKIAEDRIRIKDSIFPLFRFKRESIKSITMLDNCPNVVSQDYVDRNGRHETSLLIKKKSYKGQYNIFTKSGRKMTAFLFVRDVNMPCIEIKTLSGLYYLNYKAENRTREIYNNIIGFMAYPSDYDDEKDVRDYSIVERVIRICIITAFLALVISLFLVLFYNLINC